MTAAQKFVQELITWSHNRIRRLVDGKECRVSNAASLYDIEDVDHRKQAVHMSFQRKGPAHYECRKK